MSTELAAPTGGPILAALVELLDRYPDRDCPPDAVGELLDEVTRLVRRARAAVRRARPKDEVKEQPVKEAPEQKPVAPAPEREQERPAAPTSTTPAVVPTAAEPKPAAVPTAVVPPVAPAASTTPLERPMRSRWPMLAGGLVLVVVALLAALIGPVGLAGIVALPGAVYAARVYRAGKPGLSRRWTSGHPA